MTVIEKINNAKGPLFTFELLPPLKGHSIERTYAAIDRLIEYQPAYINFTSHRNETILRERPDGLLEKRVVRLRPGTFALAAAVKYKYNILVVPHVLCGGFTKEETENVLIEMRFLGIDDVLALRGDPQKGSRAFIPEKDGHTHTYELVQQIVVMNKGKYLEDNLENADPINFCIGVAGYPEKHFEAANRLVDMENLKRKVDEGASYIVTQMFFDNNRFCRFRAFSIWSIAASRFPSLASKSPTWLCAAALRGSRSIAFWNSALAPSASPVLARVMPNWLWASAH